MSVPLGKWTCESINPSETQTIWMDSSGTIYGVRKGVAHFLIRSVQPELLLAQLFKDIYFPIPRRARILDGSAATRIISHRPNRRPRHPVPSHHNRRGPQNGPIASVISQRPSARRQRQSIKLTHREDGSTLRPLSFYLSTGPQQNSYSDLGFTAHRITGLRLHQSESL